METESGQLKKVVKQKGGRPPKAKNQVRGFKHEVYLSEEEENKLQLMISKTGQAAADLFRHGLLEKGLRIPKARIAPTELIELMRDFKKKSGILQLLAHRERDFTKKEREWLMGSSDSITTTIERLERSTFLSLNKADDLEQLRQLINFIEQVKNEMKVKDMDMGNKYKHIEKLIEKTKQLLQQHYQYLTLT